MRISSLNNTVEFISFIRTLAKAIFYDNEYLFQASKSVLTL